MSLGKLKELLAHRPPAIILIHLTNYASSKSAATDFEHTFALQDDKAKLINEFEIGYREMNGAIRTVGLKKVREQVEREERDDFLNDRDIRNWRNQVDVMEESLKGTAWVLKESGPSCVSGTEAENDDLYIQPRFITNPDRFAREYISCTTLIDYKLIHPYRKVSNILAEHLDYKSKHIWSISDIGTFLKHFFRMPKKFEDIKKYLPEKDLKEIIQLFYILKYQFKLKRYLRIQSRRRREDLISEHVKKITSTLRKTFPNKDFLTQTDLTSLMSQEKFEVPEIYFEKFGKDTSKLQQAMRDFQDYSKYKETAFGGEKIADEGNYSQEEYRKGTSQWTFDEKMLFVKLYKILGRNWSEIAIQIQSKSPSQVRNFYQNYKKKLKLDNISEEQDDYSILASAGITNKPK